MNTTLQSSSSSSIMSSVTYRNYKDKRRKFINPNKKMITNCLNIDVSYPNHKNRHNDHNNNNKKNDDGHYMAKLLSSQQQHENHSKIILTNHQVSSGKTK